jgi:hypothetical protein
MNEAILHPNDVKNARKHRKMIRRGAPHYRGTLPESTYSYRGTGKLEKIQLSDGVIVWREIIKTTKSRRMVDWCYIPPRAA